MDTKDPAPAASHRCSSSGKRPTCVLRWFSLLHAERLKQRSEFPLRVVEEIEVGLVNYSTPRATGVESTVRWIRVP